MDAEDSDKQTFVSRIKRAPIELACPCCATKVEPTPLLQRNEDTKTFDCLCCGIAWDLRVFDQDAQEVIREMPWVLDHSANGLED